MVALDDLVGHLAALSGESREIIESFHSPYQAV